MALGAVVSGIPQKALGAENLAGGVQMKLPNPS